MRAAAGEIAAPGLSKFRQELPDDGLIEYFTRDAARLTEDPSGLDGAHIHHRHLQNLASSSGGSARASVVR